MSSAETRYRTAVTAAVLARLELDAAPWQQPRAGHEDRFVPYNMITGYEIRGANALTLLCTHFTDPRWCSRGAAEQRGWRVRDDELEKAQWLEYWEWPKDGGRPKVLYGRVYNAEQVEGVPERERGPLRENGVAWVMRALERSQAVVLEDASKPAYYSAQQDVISLPPSASFGSMEQYAGTVLNKLAYWTGHESRLGRAAVTSIGSVEYVRERLCGELASLFLADKLGVPFVVGMPLIEKQAVRSMLHTDKHAIFRAAKDAETVMDYITDLALGKEQQRVATRETKDKGMTVQAPGRQYLFVPYAEGKEAAAAGARWDKAVGKWWVPENRLAAVECWRYPATQVEAENDFGKACAAAGLIEPKNGWELDGNWHATAVVGGKPKHKNGGYTATFDVSEGKGKGFIKNFLEDTRSCAWHFDGVGNIRASVSPEELAMAQAKRDADAAALERHTEEMRERVAATAQSRVARLRPAESAHPYLVRKKVKAFGLLLDGNKLVMPLRDAAGKVWSLQAIDPDGNKMFDKDGRTQGCFHLIGNFKPGMRVLEAEGYATGATLHMAVGMPVAVALNAGNLLAVAEALKTMGASEVIVCGDDDRFVRCPIGWKEVDGEKQMVCSRQELPNSGRDKALEAAAAVGGQAVFPKFRDSDYSGTDFNDLHGDMSVLAVKRQLDVVLRPAKTLELVER